MNNRVKNILSGVLLIALAACLVLWKMDVFALPDIFQGVKIWEMIIAIIMVVIIFHSILDLAFGGIFFPLAILCIIFDEALGITAITPWIVLIAALLLTIAFEKLFPSHWIKRHFKKGFNEAKENIHREFRGDDHNRTSGNSGIDENVEYDDSEYVYHSVKMGSGSKYVNSKNLKTADLSIEFGDLSVYLDKAEVPGKEVTINTKVAFGNMDLYIPRDWNITNKVSVSMGDCDDHASSIYGEEGGVHCTINGSVAFGELAIHKV